MNFVGHTKTSFTRRVHTNRLEPWSFSQGVQASLVRQQSWRDGISNESNSHADVCKTHAQWIHCFKQSHQSYLPTGECPGLNHLLFRVAKCLARGQKFKKSLQNTAYKCFFFLYRLMWLIYLCNPNEPSQCLKPSTQGQSNKGAVGIGEVSYNLCHIFEDRVKISAPWGKNNSKRMDRSCNLVHGV